MKDMWSCNRCHSVFEQPEWRLEAMDDDAWGAGASEVLTPYCPECDSGDVGEVESEEKSNAN